jgi:acyl-coenzyme A synthetase/AMP-(fatty) acid ligase
MADWFVEERIEGIVAIPTVLRFMLPTLAPDQKLEHLQLLGMIGEASTWNDIEALQPHVNPGFRFYNWYGTTETGLVSAYEVPLDGHPGGSGPVPVGWPIQQSEIEILDGDGSAVPDGEVGEITVTSSVIGLSYWKRPDADAEARRRSRLGR